MTGVTGTVQLLTLEEMERKRREEWKRHEDQRGQTTPETMDGCALLLGYLYRRRLFVEPTRKSGVQRKISAALSLPIEASPCLDTRQSGQCFLQFFCGCLGCIHIACVRTAGSAARTKQKCCASSRSDLVFHNQNTFLDVRSSRRRSPSSGSCRNSPTQVCSSEQCSGAQRFPKLPARRHCIPGPDTFEALNKELNEEREGESA